VYSGVDKEGCQRQGVIQLVGPFVVAFRNNTERSHVIFFSGCERVRGGWVLYPMG